MQRLDTPGLRPLAPTGATPIVADPRQAAFQRALQPLVGQTVQGAVLAKMSDGSFLVRVADTNARMMLPAGADVGADVPMTVVAAQPRPLLQVGTEPAQSPVVHTQTGAAARGAAALLSKAPLTPSEQLPQLDRNTPQATLSPAARAIATALTQAYTAPGAPVVILGKTPLVATGAPVPEQLGKQLQNALGESGLFYESHVAEWAAGKRPLQDLAREPQMQRHAAAQAQQSPAESAARALAGPDLSASQMINQQLHTQEQGKVQWHGEAWPGQPMQWEVRREERDERSRRDGRDAHEEAPVWRSGVKFRFPLLGKVAANVTMVGDQVHVQVQSGDESTTETLRAWAGMLHGALDAAGAPLTSLSIGTTEAEGDHAA